MSFKNLRNVLLVSAMVGLSAVSFGKIKRIDGYPKRPVEMVAPGGAGGGWDLTARTVSKVLKDEKIITVPTPVVNRPGGGGGVNLAYMQSKKGNGQMVSIYSPPLILTKLTGTSEYGYEDTTPIAGLIADYGAFVVGKNSKFKNINEVMDALKRDPKSVKIGGSSSAGSMDHIQFLLMAKAAGVENLKDIDYVSFQESGVTQILGGHIDLFTTGLSEVKGLMASGNLRALASTADKTINGVPSCKEEGINGTFVNWRGIFANPGVETNVVEYWTKAMEEMVKTKSWKEALVRNGWDNNFMVGKDFRNFLANQEKDSKGILKEIGMLKD
ncbi:MAG: tripartite tricarboxylate transporter substrate binding protein [Fusobacterium sp. JB019]|nr:tripartite tricarboxylate transporter substrate binding protein [Fusobacterium sp. JB020]MDP0507104.1 tripartite tricarboxylate transporter substrate binding protein [Fusobacterium sp. JB019]